MTTAGLLPIRDAADLERLLDQRLTCPQTFRMAQARIDGYADIVEDHQWIHVDGARCAAESPFRTTIAHGFLTLSMMPWFLERTLSFEGGRLSLNYGLDRVRFIRPVPADAQLQGGFTLARIDAQDWGWQLSWDVAIAEAGPAAWERPSLVARWLTRWYR